MHHAPSIRVKRVNGRAHFGSIRLPASLACYAHTLSSRFWFWSLTVINPLPVFWPLPEIHASAFFFLSFWRIQYWEYSGS